MSTLARIGNYIFVIFSVSVYAVPPKQCFAKFRWEDCGKPPVPVVYYYKSGSRCEVALWKGCLPNPNMFSDEYSCINTCIFVQRPERDMDETEPFIEIFGEDKNDTDVTTSDGNDVSNTTGGLDDSIVNSTTGDNIVAGNTTGDPDDGNADAAGEATGDPVTGNADAGDATEAGNDAE